MQNERYQRRPWDDLQDAGPPSNPIKFDPPRLDRGRRDRVLCYREELLPNNHFTAHNVLFRESDADGTFHRVERAYWPIKSKQTVDSIMGHVEVCLVLKRCVRHFNDGSRGIRIGTENDVVFQVTSNPEEYVAVKVNYWDRIGDFGEFYTEDILKEISALQLIGDDHPNIMGIREVLDDEQNLYEVMSYCDYGELFNMMDGPYMPEPVARYWFRQVMAGLQYIHSKGICHRNLSPESILIDKNQSVIIDLGMSLRMPYTDPLGPTLIVGTSNIGNGTTPRPLVLSPEVTDITRGTHRRLINPQGRPGNKSYMSPEIWINRRPFDGVAIDVWTAGTILFCLVTGFKSYSQCGDRQYYRMTKFLPQLIRYYGIPLSDECVDLLQSMMQPHPRDRLTLEEVLDHPWFAHPDLPL